MFDSLSTRLQDVFKSLRGETRLTPETIEAALREIRLALLEADVNFKVVKAFVDRVRDRAMGRTCCKACRRRSRSSRSSATRCWPSSATPRAGCRPASKRPRVVLLLGLQGAGKTTTAGKLAKWLTKQGKHPLLVSTDVKRPAAIQQLNVVAKQAGVRVYDPAGELDPVTRAKGALAEAANLGFDTVIVDSAGRLHIDDELMTELVAIKDVTAPSDLLYVADAMTGQDAIKSAGEFNRQIGVTGVVLTKLDGDARGGAALSVVSVVGVPIAFVGSGERLEDLEPFHPERVVSRVLGMGDVLSLIERAEQAIDHDDAARLEEKIRSNEFTLEDFRDQLKTIRQDGPARANHRHAAGHGQHQGARREQTRREADRPRRGDHRLDDARGTAQAAHHQRQPSQAHREGQRHFGRRGQPPAQAVRADAEDAQVPWRHGRAVWRWRQGRPSPGDGDDEKRQVLGLRSKA